MTPWLDRFFARKSSPTYLSDHALGRSAEDSGDRAEYTNEELHGHADRIS